MKAVAFSIAIPLFGLIFFDWRVAKYFMLVPFTMNLVLMAKLLLFIKSNGLAKIENSKAFRETFLHLFLWILISITYLFAFS